MRLTQRRHNEVANGHLTPSSFTTAQRHTDSHTSVRYGSDITPVQTSARHKPAQRRNSGAMTLHTQPEVDEYGNTATYQAAAHHRRCCAPAPDSRCAQPKRGVAHCNTHNDALLHTRTLTDTTTHRHPLLITAKHTRTYSQWHRRTVTRGDTITITHPHSYSHAQALEHYTYTKIDLFASKETSNIAHQLAITISSLSVERSQRRAQPHALHHRRIVPQRGSRRVR
jgi:hypothetical protein